MLLDSVVSLSQYAIDYSEQRRIYEAIKYCLCQTGLEEDAQSWHELEIIFFSLWSVAGLIVCA